MHNLVEMIEDVKLYTNVILLNTGPQTNGSNYFKLFHNYVVNFIQVHSRVKSQGSPQTLLLHHFQFWN